MRLTIIPNDQAVYKNGECFSDLVWKGTPANVHALQWFTNKGWIEFTGESGLGTDKPVNEEITELPQWALNALDAWQMAYDIANTPVEEEVPTSVPTSEQTQDS